MHGQPLYNAEPVMWAAVSSELLEYGVQAMSARKWISRISGARDNKIQRYRWLSHQFM